ncbi:hypothetical protein OAD72_01565 [Candidatus Pelagibacter sp.]|nr:hypothetical protein [Candidatus Pelagibacter sp.]
MFSVGLTNTATYSDFLLSIFNSSLSLSCSINLFDLGQLQINPIILGGVGWAVKNFKVLESEIPQILQDRVIDLND